MSHPHKSTTHEERYFHLRDYNGFGANATVFMRQEIGGQWYGSAAFCHVNDNFCRKVGRSVARRKYFGYGNRYPVEGPTSEEAMKVLENVLPARLF